MRRLKLHSKDGCISCKLSKRKCDEVRPVCGGCLNKKPCRWLDQLSSDEQQQYVRRKDQGRKVELRVVVKPLRDDHENIQVSFLLHSMFRGADLPCSGAGGSANTVHTELWFASDTKSLTYHCLMAMAMVYWGSSHKDKRTLDAGYAARGTSLARMRDALLGDVSTMSGDVVAAVALTRVFETMLPDGQRQWAVHAQGLAKVFAAMGPGSFVRPEMRRLIENNKWPIITSNSALQMPTMFDSDAWRTVPWQGVEKNMLQRLLDTYSRVPKAHWLWDRNDPEIVPQLELILLELHDWRASVEIDAKLWTPKETVEPCPWRAAISVDSLIQVYSLALFNMILIVLSRYILKYPEVGGSGPVLEEGLLTVGVLPMVSPLARASKAADEIASLIPWALQQKYRGAGSFYMAGEWCVLVGLADDAGPIYIADQYWQLCKPERAQWSGGVVHSISSSWTNVMLSGAFQW